MLPRFLSRLDDANFYLLPTSPATGCVRIAAVGIERFWPLGSSIGPVYDYRVIGFNLDRVEYSDETERSLREGTYFDEIHYSGTHVSFIRDEGDDEEVKVVFHLHEGDTGRYCEFKSSLMQNAEAISTAVREMDRRGKLEWQNASCG